MARRRRKSVRRRRNVSYVRRRRRNPVSFANSPRRRRRFRIFGRPRRRRRNPALALPLRELVPITAWGIAGGVATRAIPQMLLKDANTGWQGYLANAVTAGVLSWGAGQWISKNAGVGILIGGATMTVGRIVEDMLGKRLVEFSPGFTGMGAGDAQYDLGLYTDAYFPVPTVSQQPFQRALPPVVAAPAPSDAASGVSGLGSTRRYNRFAGA